MKSIKLVVVAFFILTALQNGFAQTAPPLRPRPTPPSPAAASTAKISEVIAKNTEQINSKTPVSRDRREQAYGKLLEAQRYIWSISQPRSQASLASGVALAKQSLQKAVELDPLLAEAYTAWAELVSREQPNGLEDAISLANLAVKINSENFGGHRLLARLYTIKSRLGSETLDPEFSQKAIAEWREIARLDPRNAEAFAFLSEYYARTKKPVERLDALRKWQASAAPLDARFYRIVIGRESDLSPESATAKFGQALLENGETREAVEVLSRAVADNPANSAAVELLSRAVESADDATAATAVQFLQQAVYANPDSAAVAEILARIQIRLGKKQEALQTIRALRRINENYSLLRLEAAILNEDGKVDEAVALVKSLIGKGKPGNGPTGNEGISDYSSLMFDDFTNYLLIADLYRQSRRGKEAVEAVNQAAAAAQTAERKEAARLTLATVQHSSGDFRAAEDTLRGILQTAPRNSVALNNLGYFLAERGEKLDEAVKLIEQALVIEPNNPSYLDSLGWTYFKLGRLAEAEKYLKNALEFDASSATVHEHLGDVHQKQGKSDLAQIAWQKALRLAAEPEEKERLKIKLNVKNPK